MEMMMMMSHRDSLGPIDMIRAALGEELAGSLIAIREIYHQKKRRKKRIESSQSSSPRRMEAHQNQFFFRGKNFHFTKLFEPRDTKRIAWEKLILTQGSFDFRTLLKRQGKIANFLIEETNEKFEIFALENH